MMNNYRDKLRKIFKKPSKQKIITILGWYCTRIIAVILWCGVIWSLLGNQALPVSDTTVMTGVTCVSAYNNETFSDLMDYLQLTTNDVDLFSNYSYVYECNITNYRYCLNTISYDMNCAPRLSVAVTLLSNLDIINNVNTTSITNLTIQFDLTDAIGKELNNGNGKATIRTLFDIPDGHFFALVTLVILSSIGGMVARLMRLPPLIGMMIAGFLLRNLPVIGIAGDISPIWSSTLRNIALVIILLRGGLALDAKQLWKLKIAVPALALLPCIIEGIVDGVISIYLLELPWRWGLMLGFILCAISPAVVVPTTLALEEKVKGINKGIVTLIVASANIDVVIAISLFSVFLGLIFSDGSIVLDAFRAPIEISVGIFYGVLCGIILWFIPTGQHPPPSKARNRFFLLFGFGLFSLFGGRRAVIGGAALSGAGALGILIVSFVAAQKWNAEDKKNVSRSFYLIWQLGQPILFGLIGSALNIRNISGTLVGKAILIVSVGLVFRLTLAVVAVTGNKFTMKEKILIALSWIPKATVQAAIGSIALDLVIQNGRTNDVDYGMTVLTVAVLAIVFCAPLGAILSSVLGPWLLKHPITENVENKENQDGYGKQHIQATNSITKEELTENVENNKDEDSDNKQQQNGIQATKSVTKRESTV